jgi:hypothetical protein
VVPTRPTPLVIDVCGITGLDERSLDVLMRLQLVARRFDATIVLRNASRELIDLLVLVGMDDVVQCARRSSGVDGQRDRQSEQREQPLLDEEMKFGDPAV